MTAKRRRKKDEVEQVEAASMPEAEQADSSDEKADNGVLAAELEKLRCDQEAERLAAADLQEQLLRNLAEKDNQIRRMERDRDRLARQQKSEIILPMLDILDDLDRALENGTENASLAEGVAMISRRFADVLGQLGLESIDTDGCRFDPMLHEAVLQVESDEAESGTIVQEVRKGYRLGDLVIRPSRVSVAG